MATAEFLFLLKGGLLLHCSCLLFTESFDLQLKISMQ